MSSHIYDSQHHVDCLDLTGKQMHLLFLPFFGTSDQPCWLTEARNFLLLLLADTNDQCGVNGCVENT